MQSDFEILNYEEIVQRNPEVRETVKKYGKNAWIYLTARLLDNGFYLTRPKKYTRKTSVLSLHDSSDLAKKMVEDLEHNLTFALSFGADLNVINEFLVCCKTDNYKEKANEVRKEYEKTINNFFYDTVIFNDYFDCVKASKIYRYQFLQEYAAAGKILAESRKNKTKTWEV